jgi:hypothetical protein
MSGPALDIELIVREVLAALGHCAPREKVESGEGREEKPVIQSPNPEIPQAPKPSSNDLLLSGRVVTMEQVAGKLQAIRRVVVSRESIVTPAVRDDLIRRGIELVRADASSGTSVKAVRLALITSGTDFDPAPLTAVLARDGLIVEHTALNCLIRSTEQLAADVSKGDALGLLLTRRTAAGLCLANRLAGVRAIAGGEASAVAAASAAVGANVLVVDPRAGTFFQLKQMVTEFRRAGVRECPTVFRAQLA